MITDFLRHFGIASNVLQLADAQGGANPSQTQLDHAAKYAAMWLTPLSVDGFESGSFRDLTDTDRSELERAVEDFRGLAEASAPTADQIREARALAAAIYRIVGRYLYDPETIQVIRAIHRLQENRRLPDFIVGFDVKLGLDSTDDPAVWIWFIVSDEAAENDRYYNLMSSFQDQVAEALDARGIRRFVYVYVRALSEQLELWAGVPE